MSRSGPTSWIAALLAVLALGLVAHRVIVDAPAGHGYANMDLDRQYWPNAVFLHEALRDGRIPLWNPYQAAGQPFYALHQPGPFYPPNLLMGVLLEPESALLLGFALHLFVAAFFTAAFVRRLGLGPLSALCAGVLVLLSPQALHGLQIPPFHASEAWLPAVFFALHGLLDRARGRDAAVLAAALALCFLGGHAQGFMYVVQWAALYGVVGLVFAVPREKRLRVALLAVASSLLAIGWMAPQLLPAIDLATQGVRGLEGLSLGVAASGGLAPGHLLAGLLRVGIAAGPTTWFVTLPWLALPLAVAGGFGHGQRRTWLFFAAMALVSGLFMLGRDAFVFPAYHALPLGDLFRSPARMAFVYGFAWAVLVALGVSFIEQRGKAGAAIALACVLVLGADAYSRTKIAVGHPALAGGAPHAPDALVEHLQTHASRDRIFVATPNRVAEPFLLRRIGMLHGLYSAHDYGPMMPRAYAAYFGIDLSQPWHGDIRLFAGGGRPATPSALRLLDLMSVRFYLVRVGAGSAPLPRLQRRIGAEGERVAGVQVIERKQALPRAYRVSRERFEPDLERALRRIRSPAFEPREEVVLVASDDTGPRQTVLGEPHGDDFVRIVDYEPHRVAIEARCEQPCRLVLTDLHSDDWRVSLDGVPASSQLANGLFRSVGLDAGEHEIVFSLAPRSLRNGTIAFGLASLVALVAWAWARRPTQDGSAIRRK